MVRETMTHDLAVDREFIRQAIGNQFASCSRSWCYILFLLPHALLHHVLGFRGSQFLVPFLHHVPETNDKANSGNNITLRHQMQRRAMLGFCFDIKEIKAKKLGMLPSEVILDHDNARPYMANRTLSMIKKLQWSLLEHPPYSPDLSS